MSAGDKYRAKALEILARAETDSDPESRSDLENLAAAYIRLAEQAERNIDLGGEREPAAEKKRTS